MWCSFPTGWACQLPFTVLCHSSESFYLCGHLFFLFSRAAGLARMTPRACPYFTCLSTETRSLFFNVQPWPFKSSFPGPIITYLIRRFLSYTDITANTHAASLTQHNSGLPETFDRNVVNIECTTSSFHSSKHVLHYIHKPSSLPSVQFDDINKDLHESIHIKSSWNHALLLKYNPIQSHTTTY